MKTFSRSILFVSILALVAVATSCKDDDEDPQASKTELLTAKSWKQTKIKAMGVEGEPDDCDKDDTYTFNKDKSYKQDEGATKCDPDDAQTINGTWEFNSGETSIKTTVTEGGISISFDQQILELTSSTLKVKYTIFDVEVEETFSH